ncbi:hypothetical protein N656DRAFT_6021 [Canariomyces notabilis]|uniref:Uncharacterized protein n=1 Tax=Canariomyces notabilis TaxID=2074819 RepID=A0AAN6YX53_9PEZI|nr:hypothetical protein N656DRAFT_6021 [Canariomyces arenarius]
MAMPNLSLGIPNAPIIYPEERKHPYHLHLDDGYPAAAACPKRSGTIRGAVILLPIGASPILSRITSENTQLFSKDCQRGSGFANDLPISASSPARAARHMPCGIPYSKQGSRPRGFQEDGMRSCQKAHEPNDSYGVLTLYRYSTFLVMQATWKPYPNTLGYPYSTISTTLTS